MNDDELLALARKATQGEWRVVSDAPNYGIACGDRRVVQTPNQNNYQKFGRSDPWHGIEHYQTAAYIAAATPSAIIALIERHRAEVERLTRERDEAKAQASTYAETIAFHTDSKGKLLKRGMEWKERAESAESAEPALAAAQKRIAELERRVNNVIREYESAGLGVGRDNDLANKMVRFAHGEWRAALAGKEDGDAQG